MIRKADLNDLSILAELSCKLWPHHTAGEMLVEYGVGMAWVWQTRMLLSFWHTQGKLPSALPNASCGTTMWRERIVRLSAIWKVSMCRRIIAMKELQSSC